MHKKHQYPTTCRLPAVNTTPLGGVAFSSLLFLHLRLIHLRHCVAILCHVRPPAGVHVPPFHAEPPAPRAPHSLSLIKTYKVPGLPPYLWTPPPVRLLTSQS